MTTHAMFCTLLAAALLSGCQTVERGPKSDVKVRVTPSPAKVTASTGDSCTSPCTLRVPRNKNFTVTATRRGYRAKTVAVKRVLNRKAATRTAASLIVPGGSALVAVDTISGAFYDHDPNPVRIHLRRR